MLRSLYRQRRRMTLLALALFYGMWARQGGFDGTRQLIEQDFQGSPILFLVSFGLSATIIALLMGVIVTYLIPNLRRGVEVFAIAIVVSDQFLQLDGLLPVWATEGFGRLAVFFICYSVIGSLLEGTLLYRWGARLPLRLSANRTLRASPEAIWAAVAPDAATLGTKAGQTISRVERRAELGPNTFEVHHKMPGGLVLIQHHSREVWNYPTQLSYAFSRPDDADDGGMFNGRYTMTCVVLRDGQTDVTITHHYPSLKPGAWLSTWLDDAGECEMDSVQARVGGRRDWSPHGWLTRQVARA